MTNLFFEWQRIGDVEGLYLENTFIPRSIWEQIADTCPIVDILSGTDLVQISLRENKSEIGWETNYPGPPRIPHFDSETNRVISIKRGGRGNEKDE